MAINSQTQLSGLEAAAFRNAGVVLFLVLVFVLAYIEEGFWDGLVWREHGEVFTLFSGLPQVTDNMWLAVLVPLLALPQVTHYVLDGFIWRISRDNHLKT